MIQRATHHLGAPGLRAFYEIAERWKLSDRQQAELLGVDELSTGREWKRRAQAREEVILGAETLRRIGLIIGVFRAINVLLPDPNLADRWMHTPNDASIFEGRTAVDRITDESANGLIVVHQYLTAQCGGLEGRDQ
jgi:hypothetical protein